MTRHKHAHTGLVTPSPLDHWIDATLRMFAMLVHLVASTLQMTRRRAPVIGTQDMPTVLPRETTDIPSKEAALAAKHSSPPHSALPEQRSFAARPSKDERVLTNAGQAMAQDREPPINASPSLRSSRRKSGSRAPRVMLATGLRRQPWIPACAGTSGENLTSSRPTPQRRGQNNAAP
jgi:hypothetical protein